MSRGVPLEFHRHPFRSNRQTRLFDAAEKLERAEKKVEEMVEEKLLNQNVTLDDEGEVSEEERLKRLESVDFMRREYAAEEEVLKDEEEAVAEEVAEEQVIPLDSSDVVSLDPSSILSLGSGDDLGENGVLSRFRRSPSSVVTGSGAGTTDERGSGAGTTDERGGGGQGWSVQTIGSVEKNDKRLLNRPDDVNTIEENEKLVMVDVNAPTCSEGTAWMHLLWTASEDVQEYERPDPPVGTHRYSLYKIGAEEGPDTFTYGCIATSPWMRIESEIGSFQVSAK